LGLGGDAASVLSRVLPGLDVGMVMVVAGTRGIVLTGICCGQCRVGVGLA
jgi:hypothetical protein